jgi:cell division protein CrgA
VPKSRVRRTSAYTPPPTRSPSKMPSAAWVAPTMVAMFLLGLLWIVVFYITRGGLPLMDALNNWNLLVGFGFIAVGFILSTRWK